MYILGYTTLGLVYYEGAASLGASPVMLQKQGG